MIPTAFIKTNTDEFRLDGLQEGGTVCIAINGFDLHIKQEREGLIFDIYYEEENLNTMTVWTNEIT